MGIINQNLDTTEQRNNFYTNLGATATGVTACICAVPNYCTLDAVQVMAFGVSGSPTVEIFVNRFIVGTGFTTFAVTSAAQSVPSFGTSGVLSVGYTLPTTGTTLLTNDVLMVQTGGANSAVTGLTISLILRPLGDRSTFFGIL